MERKQNKHEMPPVHLSLPFIKVWDPERRHYFFLAGTPITGWITNNYAVD